MSGVQLTGHGGFEKLIYRTDLAIPEPGKQAVLIKVGAYTVNNTDINTPIGWYSKKKLQPIPTQVVRMVLNVLTNPVQAGLAYHFNFPVFKTQM